MYKILGADQKEYGPISADSVRQWIAEGRLSAQTPTKLEGDAAWKPLAEFAEFAPALAAKGVGASSRPPIAPGGSGVPTQPKSGLAVASLVLGLMSMVACSFITGIPAIITGHIARGRANRDPQTFGGRGLALAGLILGYVSLAFIPIMAGLLLPALAKAKAKAQQINCINQMKQIGLAARIWSSDNGGNFPPNFMSMSNELASPKVLVCPADGSKVVATDWGAFSPENVSYEYLEPGIAEKDTSPQTVVFQCPIHGSVGLADGSVQMGGQRVPRNRR